MVYAKLPKRCKLARSSQIQSGAKESYGLVAGR